MSIKYFGKRATGLGKPLWEIALNLKHFGKGRMVVRSSLEENYPNEPTFFRIVSVHPHVIEYPCNMRGNFFVDMVYRGRKREVPHDIGDDACYPDFRLVHKSEEHIYLKRFKQYQDNPPKTLIHPRTAELPPLWKEILSREANAPVNDMPLIHSFEDPEDIRQPMKIAEEGEEPSYKIGTGQFKAIHKRFYEHVIWDKEAAKVAFSAKKPELQFVYEDRKRHWSVGNDSTAKK